MAYKVEEVGRGLEKFIREIKGLLPLLETESVHIRELRTRPDSERCPNHIEEIRRLKKENEELKREIQTCMKDRSADDDKKASINKYEKISAQMEHLSRKYEEKKAENMKLKKDIENLSTEKFELEKKCDDYNFRIKNLEQVLQNKEEQNDAINQQNERKHKNLRDKLEQTEKELQETKLRLSQYMGHQLADSNPNITDLSDQNRPTKIGEMFASLYDDEYTNAFEEIDVDYSSNKETCGTLLDLLMEAKTFCDRKAADQLRALKQECLVQDKANMDTDSSLIDYSLKEMKDIRKKNARKSLKYVYEKFADHMTHKKKASIFRHPNRYPKTVEYVKMCVEICWLMAVQDPPMAFGPLPRRYDWFDSNLYRPYTKSGKEVDFVVWPVLYLHEKGSVLCKGILEPIKHDMHDYTAMRDSAIVGRPDESRIFRHSTRTPAFSSDVQWSSIKADDMYFSSSRDTHSNSERTRQDIASERSSHLQTERVTPAYQQETLLTRYNRLPWSLSRHYDVDFRNSDRWRTRGKNY